MSRLPAVGALLVLGLAGCANVNPDPTVPRTSAHADAIRLAAVGDSITDADSPGFSRGELGAESWVSHVVGDGVTFAGGWAAWGATTGDMARNVEAIDADVLVVMAGTNDVAYGTPFAESAANIADIVTTVGASEVIIAGIPPIDHAPDTVTDFNHSLRRLADQHDWHWVDAGASVRTNNGSFTPGMSVDGVHPTVAGAKRLGESIYTAIEELTTPSTG